MSGDEQWFDEAAGPLVRPYAMTGGRTRPGAHDLNIITLVLTVPGAAEGDSATLGPEHREILRLCRELTSVAEVGAALDLPLAVVKVLIGDLIDRGRVTSRSPVANQRMLTTSFLQEILDGIERI